MLEETLGSKVWLRSGLDAVGKQELVYNYLNSYPEEEKSRGRPKLWVVKQQYSLILARTEGMVGQFSGWMVVLFCLCLIR